MTLVQQDGAPSHTSNATQTHLEQVVPHFIKKDEWPQQINPMDYTITKIHRERTEGENSGNVGGNYSGRSQEVNRVIQKET